MAGQEKELLEALNSSRILTSMITPAVLISACGTLIFSTSARLGRIFDRVNVMKGEVEEIITGKISYPVERMKHLRGQSLQAIVSLVRFFPVSSAPLIANLIAESTVVER